MADKISNEKFLHSGSYSRNLECESRQIINSDKGSVNNDCPEVADKI